MKRISRWGMVGGGAAFFAVFCIFSQAEAVQKTLDKSAIGQVSAQLGIPFPHTLQKSLRRLNSSAVPGTHVETPDAADSQAPPGFLPGLLPDSPGAAAVEEIRVKEVVAEHKTEHAPEKIASVGEKKPRVVPHTAVQPAQAQNTQPAETFPVKQAESLQPRVAPVSRQSAAAASAHTVSVPSREMLDTHDAQENLLANTQTNIPAEIPAGLSASLDDAPAVGEFAVENTAVEDPFSSPGIGSYTDTQPAASHVTAAPPALTAAPPVMASSPSLMETHPAALAAEPELLPRPGREPVMETRVAETYLPTPHETETSVADVLPPPALSAHMAEETAVVTEIRGTGTPGPATMEGTQAPRLSVEKTAPEEIQVGKPSVWAITVKNEGGMEARGVQIHDVIPRGAKLVSTSPRAVRSETGELTWNVGNMPAGTMAVVKVELMPVEEGTIGSVASVTFRSEASAKSVATRPQLTIQTVGDARLLVGTPTELIITVSNPGSGITRNVVLAETVPAELQFDGGAELIYKLGDLHPGETKQVKLPLTAVRPGGLTNTIVATADANLRAESQFAMEVTAPAMKVAMDGPNRRFLEREGTYKMTVTNPGTAPAKNIEMNVTLPSGTQFVRANNGGGYLADSRSVCWRLAELQPGDTAVAEMVVTLMETGTLAMKYDAVADTCPVQRGEKAVQVEGIAALMFQVSDTNDPVQVGEETTYEVNVVNQGSKQAEDVCVVVRIPAGMQVMACKAPTQHTVQGNEIHFAPLSQLAPKAEMLYELRMRGLTTGDQRVSVSLSSKEFPTPIVKEESTRVYAE